MMKNLVAAIAAGWLAMGMAHADAVVFDTYGADNLAYGSNWALDRIDNARTAQKLAVPFVLDEAMRISSVMVAVDNMGSFTLGVEANHGALPKEAFIHSIALAIPSMAPISLDWILPAGSYWLVGVPDNDTMGVWHGGGEPGSVQWAVTNHRTRGSGWRLTGPDDAPAARIWAGAVPEAGVTGMTVAGLLVVGARTLRRRRGRLD